MPLLELIADTFESSLLDDQPIFDPQGVRALLGSLAERSPEERMQIDGLLNRVLSMTLMHQRFAMSG
jgi:hypothetical protein